MGIKSAQVRVLNSRQGVLAPYLAGLQRLVDGLLLALGAVLSTTTAAALHDAGELHLLVPGARQHIMGFAVLIRHHAGHLKRERRDCCGERDRKMAATSSHFDVGQ